MELYISEAKTCFTEEQWNDFDENEQLKYGQVCYIYYACVNLGIQIVVPDFMQKDKNKLLLEKHKKSKCKYCNIVFAVIEDKEKHMKSCKKRFDFIEKKKHACNECNYSTDNSSQLSKHKMIHTKGKRFSCDVCKKGFLTKHNLKMHINTIHLLTTKKFSCDKCAYKSKYKHHFIQHVKTHTGIKRYVCEICNKGFNYQSELKFHSYQHENKEKPYKCSYCGKDFIQKQHFTRHVNAIHLKKKEFKCDKCDYSSAHKCDLKTHSYKHLKDKPFKCQFCDFQCCNSSHLKWHLKHKHYK